MSEHRPSASRLRDLWERAQEDVAQLMATEVEQQQRQHRIVATHQEIYRELFGVDAPDFELAVRRVG